MLRHHLDLDVRDMGIAGLERLAADLLVPDGVTEGPLLVGFPGGGMNRRYFDLPDALGEQWSMAVHLVETIGVAVAMIDHPGVGDSDVPDDPWVLVPSVVADVDVAGLHALRSECERSGLWRVTSVIGCGHSMGAMLVVRMQARHQVFDALALLGYSGSGLPNHVPAEALQFGDDFARLEAALPDLTRTRFGEPLRPTTTTVSDFLAPDAAKDAREVLSVATTDLLTICGLASMIPESSSDATPMIDIPVFVGVGERDIAGPIASTIERFPAAPTVEGFVLPGAGHNHTISRNRVAMYDAVGRFVTAVASQN